MAKRNGNGPNENGPNTGSGLGPCKTTTPKKRTRPIKRTKKLLKRFSK